MPTSIRRGDPEYPGPPKLSPNAARALQPLLRWLAAAKVDENGKIVVDRDDLVRRLRLAEKILGGV
jgi:hypothetical protein